MTDTNKLNKFEFDNDFFEVNVTNSKNAVLAEEERETAYADGVAAGRRQMQEELGQQAQQTAQAFTAAVTHLQSMQESWLAVLGKQSIQLLQTTLTHVLGHAAENYPADLLDKHLRETIAQLPLKQDLILRFHPSAASFHERLGQKQAEIQGHIFELRPDPSVPLGDCSVEWDIGGLETSLSHMEQQIQEALGSLHPAPDMENLAGDDSKTGQTPSPTAEPTAEVGEENSEETTTDPTDAGEEEPKKATEAPAESKEETVAEEAPLDPEETADA